MYITFIHWVSISTIQAPTISAHHALHCGGAARGHLCHVRRLHWLREAGGRRWMGQRNPAPVEDAGKHPIIYRGSTILLVMQDFFHPQYHHLIWGMATNKIREAEFRANITSKHGKNLAKGGSWINKHFGIWV